MSIPPLSQMTAVSDPGRVSPRPPGQIRANSPPPIPQQTFQRPLPVPLTLGDVKSGHRYRVVLSDGTEGIAAIAKKNKNIISIKWDDESNDKVVFEEHFFFDVPMPQQSLEVVRHNPLPQHTEVIREMSQAMAAAVKDNFTNSATQRREEAKKVFSSWDETLPVDVPVEQRRRWPRMSIPKDWKNVQLGLQVMATMIQKAEEIAALSKEQILLQMKDLCRDLYVQKIFITPAMMFNCDAWLRCNDAQARAWGLASFFLLSEPPDGPEKMKLGMVMAIMPEIFVVDHWSAVWKGDAAIHNARLPTKVNVGNGNANGFYSDVECFPEPIICQAETACSNLLRDNNFQLGDSESQNVDSDEDDDLSADVFEITQQSPQRDKGQIQLEVHQDDDDTKRKRTKCKFCLLQVAAPVRCGTCFAPVHERCERYCCGNVLRRNMPERKQQGIQTETRGVGACSHTTESVSEERDSPCDLSGENDSGNEEIDVIPRPPTPLLPTPPEPVSIQRRSVPLSPSDVEKKAEANSRNRKKAGRLNVLIEHKIADDFRISGGLPHPAGMKWGKDILTVEIHPQEVSDETQACLLSKEAADRHKRMIVLVQQVIAREEQLQNCHMTLAFIQAINMLQKEFKWAHSTRMCNAAAFEAALKRLDWYTNFKMNPIMLDNTSIWREAMRHWKHQTNIRSGSLNLPVLSPEMSQMTYTRLLRTSKIAAVVFALTWAHAARPTNTAKVLKKEIKFEGTRCKVVWVRAKTAATKGPYTTISQLYRDREDLVKRFLSTLHDDEPLVQDQQIPSVMAIIRKAMREGDPKYDLKAMRRGALTTLAKTGLPVDDLMRFSGHKDKQTLFRYLGWGEHLEEHAAKAEEAAKALW